MARGPLSSEAKAALLKRLAEGRSKTKAARSEAKEKGLPDPKPRKARAKKNSASAEPLDKAEAVNPSAHPAAREDTRPISGAKNNATNAVAAMPPNPEETKSTKIDVPNLPDAKSRKRIVKDAEVLPESKPVKDLSSTGRTEKTDVNNLLVNKETGNQAIPAQYPGQKESIKKLLKKNKTENKPEAPAPVPVGPEVTTKSVIKHVPDVKAIEARAPFSFSAIRKALYQ
jgi:hypothetical protein